MPFSCRLKDNVVLSLQLAFSILERTSFQYQWKFLDEIAAHKKTGSDPLTALALKAV